MIISSCKERSWRRNENENEDEKGNKIYINSISRVNSKHGIDKKLCKDI